MSDDPVEVYLKEVGRIEPLSPGEEVELAEHLRLKDEQAELAGERLAAANLAMVVSIAQRHSSSIHRVLDLTQIGNAALLRALNTFPESGVGSFSAHAAACVEDAIGAAASELR